MDETVEVTHDDSLTDSFLSDCSGKSKPAPMSDVDESEED